MIAKTATLSGLTSRNRTYSPAIQRSAPPKPSIPFQPSQVKIKCFKFTYHNLHSQYLSVTNT